MVSSWANIMPNKYKEQLLATQATAKTSVKLYNFLGRDLVEKLFLILKAEEKLTFFVQRKL
jgi:hypothetical protein